MYVAQHVDTVYTCVPIIRRSKNVFRMRTALTKKKKKIKVFKQAS